MISKKWLIALLPVLLLLIILALPARLLWNLTASQLAPAVTSQFSLQGISGRWWSGQAASLTWLGRHRGELHWRLVTPLTFAVELTHPQQRLQAQLGPVDVSVAGRSIRLRHVEASMEAANLPELWPQIRLQGQLQATLQQVKLQFNQQLLLQGEINWTAARLAGAAALDMGNIEIALQPEKNHTLVEINNRDGKDLQIRGSGSLFADHYAVLLRLRPVTGRDGLNQQLAWLGQRQPDGSYQLSLQGAWQ